MGNNFKIKVGHLQSASGFTPQPGYEVTGEFTDGGSITISGTGFGTMGGDALLFARGDEGSNALPVNGASVTLGTINTFVSQLADDTAGDHLFFSNARTRSGRALSMRRSHLSRFDGQYRMGGMGWAGLTSTPLIYVSYYRFFSGLPVVGATDDNLKQMYLTGNGTSPLGSPNTPPAAILIPATNTYPWKIAINTNGDDSGSTNQSLAIGLTDTSGVWQRWEFALKFNSSGAVSDGRASAWVDGVTRIDNTSYKWFGNTWAVAPTRWKDARVGHMDQRYTDDTLVDYSDLYVADTLARVEIGDAPTWQSCTHKEVQLARNSAWTDISVAATLNVGAHGTLSGKYLYVIKSDGSSVKIGSFS